MTSRKAEGNVYRIKNTRDNIVDDMLDILDGPRPMTKMKPDKLKPTSADKFQAAQDEYEARGKCSTDYIDRVRRHNSGYPQLKDELEKRRSLIKVTMNKANAAANFPDDLLSCPCYVCLKLRRKEVKMKSKSKRIGNRQNQRRVKRSNRYSRRPKFDKNDKNCRCRPNIDKIDGGKSRRSITKMLKIKDVAENDSQDGKDSARSVSKSYIGSDYPATTNPSAPSYNSSLSLELEQEPMDG